MIPFDTKAIPVSIDPEGGYSLQLKDVECVEDESVFDEVKSDNSLPISSNLIEFIFRCTLETMAGKVAKDCKARKIGNLLKFQPTLRGKVKNAYSAYDASTCSSAITVSSLSGLEKSIDTSKVAFKNVRDLGNQVTITRLSYLGADEDRLWMKTKKLLVVGYNLQDLEGDITKVSYNDAEGTAHSFNITPTESDVNHRLYDFPTELADVAVNTELTIFFRARGGVAESEPQELEKTVKLIAAA